MRKIVCLALRRHQLRVVQEFTPQCRRIKCERCGGDWGMNDADDLLGIKAALVEWDPNFEQFFRDRGFEILEPVVPAEAGIPALVDPLGWQEVCRALRWPGAIAMFMGVSSSLICLAADLGGLALSIASFAIPYAIMELLKPRAFRRAYERRRSTLEA